MEAAPPQLNLIIELRPWIMGWMVGGWAAKGAQAGGGLLCGYGVSALIPGSTTSLITTGARPRNPTTACPLERRDNHLNGELPMPYQNGEVAGGNGIDPNNELAHQEARQSKRTRPAQRDSVAQQRAAIAEQRLEDLRATLLDLRQERDAWREQAQRLALRENPSFHRPGWWQWGRGG